MFGCAPMSRLLSSFEVCRASSTQLSSSCRRLTFAHVWVLMQKVLFAYV